MRQREALTVRDTHGILWGPEHIESSSDGLDLSVRVHAAGATLCEVAAAGAEDVDLAVTAAQEAAPGWAALPAHERGRLLLKLADRIEADTAALARLEAVNTGHPIRDCLNLDVPRTALCFRYFGGMADKLEGSVFPVDAGFLNYVDREPIGVVSAIVPWNFPLMFTSWKLGPALAVASASSSCLKVKTVTKGPNTSSCATRSLGLARTIVGSTKNPP